MKTKVVHKYQIPDNGWYTSVHLPKGFKVVLVGLQDGLPTVWIEETIDEPKDYKVNFYVAGTGEHMDELLTHAGSYIADEGKHIWHVYYVEEKQ